MKEQDYLDQQLWLIEIELKDCDPSETEKLKEISDRKQKYLIRKQSLSS